MFDAVAVIDGCGLHGGGALFLWSGHSVLLFFPENAPAVCPNRRHKSILQSTFSIFCQLLARQERWAFLLAFAPVCCNRTGMKSAYELAMERLQANSPSVPLTDEQRAKIAELDSAYQAKIAEKEIFLKGQMAKAMEQGDLEALASLEKQLSVDRAALQAELEEKKGEIRSTTN